MHNVHNKDEYKNSLSALKKQREKWTSVNHMTYKSELTILKAKLYYV